ncbi:MAG: LuxR C-terminal-related transcriptional regulator [Actinomycetota bacterium]
MEAKTATVVIAAGHGAVGEVARRACEAEPGIEVVAEVRDEAGLFDACRRIRPDVLVLDDRLHGGEPTLESLRAMREEGVSVAAVVLTDRADGAAVLEALRLGVRGYVRKSDGLPGIGGVVRRVADGERAVDPDLEQAAVMALGRFAQQAREGSEVEASLTARELEILAMVSQGLTMQQVGRRLGISPRTVETHVAKLYRKLGVRTRVQAVARAAQLGLIEP